MKTKAASKIVSPIAESDWPRVLELRRRAQHGPLAKEELELLTRAVATDKRRFACMNDQVVFGKARAR